MTSRHQTRQRRGGSARGPAALALALAIGAIAAPPVIAQSAATDQFARDLDALAKDVSALLADGDARALVAAQIKESPRKNVITLRESLSAAIDRSTDKTAEPLLALAARIDQAEASMKHCGLTAARLEMKLPVASHRDLINQSDTIYVLAAPLADESEVKTLTAYSRGEPVTLSAAEPPRVPTLVILPAESESAEPTYPLMFSQDEGDEANKARVVDDYVGIARIWIQDDHESWPSGDPEIYVRVLRYYRPTCTWINHKIDLPGVNGEQVWYDLGDPNGTYRYVDGNYGSVMYFQVWEEDNFFHGGDDFLGSVAVNWTALPFGGYTTFIAGDARLRIDRD